MVYFNSDDLAFRLDATTTPTWGNGEPIYVMCAVKDSGIGISEEGQKRLFERFRQATPKTAELYGGSGLGLNISRKMCHLHGGEIGVSSKEGAGSTFGFFFKVKRTTAPEESSETQTNDTEIETEQWKSQARALGRVTGTAAEDEEIASASIKSPPVVEADEATPHPDGSKDARYQKTVKVASRVEEPGPDEYANSARPKISEQHRSGSNLQSAELGKGSAEHSNSEPSGGVEDSQPKQHVLLVEDNVIVSTSIITPHISCTPLPRAVPKFTASHPYCRTSAD